MPNEICVCTSAISVVGRCTLACKHCYEESHPKVEEQFSREEIEHFLTVFIRAGISHVFIAGGEPLLHPDLPKFVRFAHARQMHVAVSSNGHLVTDEILSDLFQAGLTHDLSISLDGPNSLVNDNIRGKGSFVRTLEGMYRLNRYGRIVWGVNYVVCGPNLGSALATALLAKSMGASYFNLILVRS